MREIKFTVRYECEETMPELDKKIIKALEGIRGCKAQYEICRTMPQPLQKDIYFIIQSKQVKK